MELYLVQHGEAEPERVDPARPLTPQGRESVRRVAAFAARLGLEVHQIRHSGKARAEQTAALLAAALSPPAGVAAASGLGPTDDVRPVGEAFAAESHSVLIVGHLPFLARLAGLLVNGDAERSPLRFRNGGIVCLTREEGRWLVAWALTPEMARSA